MKLNHQQILSVVKGLLIVGGPVNILLTEGMHLDAGIVAQIMTIASALCSIAGMVWLVQDKSDDHMIKDAGTVTGAQVHIDLKEAAPEVAALALNGTKDVVPMEGPPRVKEHS